MAKKVDPDFSGEAGPALYSARWRFGPFELDETSRELRHGGVVVTIEAKPLNMLMLFLRNPGELVTKDELLDKLWTGRIVGEAVIGNCVKRLRQVLGEDASGWLRSVHGIGYRFDGPVQLVEDQRATPPAAPKLDFQPGDQPPFRPNWQLLRRLGNSGDSWLAEHTKTRARRVFKFTREAAGLSALKREVTVYRLLRESSSEKIFHVDLLDWNFDEPPWFIEAEYCPGGSLQEWFEAQGGTGKVPLATRLDLIAQIGEALAEVHAVGVLHKDLKPANVFVVIEADGRPTIRLADFGASRLLDPARLAALEITRLGFTQLIDNNSSDNGGTPLYFAPELLAGHPATVKADIYALGVMLYQFVIGNLRRQLTPGWEAEVVDEILRSDIAAAAEGNPERRLADASELARNLRRLEVRRMTREAERAAAEKAERAARALERIKARRVGVMAAFAALAIGFAASAVLYVDARNAGLRATEEARRATAVSDFLTRDLLAPVTSGDAPVKDITMEQILEAGSARIDTRFASQPDVAADLHSAIGNSYSALELSEKAEHELDRAIDEHIRLYGKSDLRAVNDAASLATLKFALGRDPKDMVVYDDIAAAALAVHGPANAAVTDLELQLASTRFYRGDTRGAADALQALYSRYVAAAADDDERIAEIADVLGMALSELAEYANAKSVLEEGIERAMRARGKQHQSIGLMRTTLARVAVELGDYAQAEKEYRQALAIAEHWGKPSSGALTSAVVGLGRLRLKQGRAGEAVAILENIISSRSSGNGAVIDQLTNARVILAEAYRSTGQTGKAEAMLNAAIASSAASYGRDHLQTRRARLALADLLASSGKREAAIEILEQPTPLSFDELGASHPNAIKLATIRGKLQPATDLPVPEIEIAGGKDELPPAIKH
ncbi:tetratricopeptide repeat protein [uncultured Nevskia sp.]|uniref:protein kinase domain-containing protein n=1 Tax=uncultured Nevskia sp. TaxID=228950 RepID=UPI0025F2D95A|nr:tetratricopeptide repeat protein [uncultured Nevskia sp.]